MTSLVGNYKISYAQNREDLILDGLTGHKKTGYYVDIGAYHPANDSVTKIFYDRGWSGVNIDANEDLIEAFNETRKRDLNLAVAVGAESNSKELTIFDNQGLSTLASGSEDPEGVSVKKRVKVRVLSLATVLRDYAKKDVDFLKIDVEGLEYEVLKSNDWTQYRPKILCIEADHKQPSWKSYLELNKYSFVFNDGINDYYVAEENKALADSFVYSSELLIEKPVIGRRAAEDIYGLEVEIKNLRTEIRKMKYSKASTVSQKNEDKEGEEIIEQNIHQRYNKIVEYAKSRQKLHDPSVSLVFEDASIHSKSCINITKEDLLGFENNLLFVRSCYYKLLDRPIDAATARHLQYALDSGAISREQIFKQIFESDEFIVKKTKFKFGVAK